MQLGDVFTGSKATVAAFAAPTKPVKFKVIGESAEAEQLIRDVEAVLRFVPEDEADECRVQAEKELREHFPDGSAPRDLVSDAGNYYILQRALRDSDDPRKPFALTVKELRAALQRRQAEQLFRAYSQWVREEFPDQLSDEQLDDLVDQAEKKS